MTPLKTKNRIASTPKNTPKFPITIKNAQGQEIICADPKATRAALLLMNMNAVTGGAACHWGGPAAAAEILSALHAHMFANSDTEWFEKFNFVNDAGHAENGVYALRANYNFGDLSFENLKDFRKLDSPLTGHGESHLYPEGVLMSNGPLGSALPQAQGLAVADKASEKKRTTICFVSDGASMEGEAKEAFAAIPGLAAKERLSSFVMILSDNNTKLSGRIDEDSYSMLPTFDSLKALGWKMVNLADGHNLEKCYQVLEEALKEAQQFPTQPICLHVKTIKGKGLVDTETSSSGGHGYPLKAGDSKLIDYLKEVYKEEEVPKLFLSWADEALKSASKTTSSATPTEKVQAGIKRALEKAQIAGLPIFSVSADLQGSTGMKPYHSMEEKYSLDIGVAESNMISTAAGLSKAGFIPIVDTFAQFGVTKGNLPLTMAVQSQAPVIAIFSHTGFQDAADGASHQATTYISAVSSIPQTKVIVCSTSAEVEHYLLAAFKEFKEKRDLAQDPSNYIFFIGRENFPIELDQNLSYDWEKPQVFGETDDADVLIASCGPLTHQALKARKLFADNGLSAIIVNNSFVNNPDIETFKRLLPKAKGRLITLEDHQIIGGMGSLLCHSLLQAGCEFQVKSLGVPGVFGRSAYKAQELYDKYELNPEGLLKSFKNWSF